MGFQDKIHHGLELPLARKALDKAMEAYSARFADYNPQFDWVSEKRGRFSFSARSLTVEGSLEIDGPEVYVELEVPFILRIFKGRAIDVIDSEVRRWCEKARNGELD